MIEHLFIRPSIVARLKGGPLGSYLDDLATILGHPHKPGHFISSITYREGLIALPRQGQLSDLR